MKNTILVLFAVTALLFFPIGKVNAQEKNNQTVIIKVYEFTANSNSKIIVVKPDGTVEENKLNKIFTSGEQNAVDIQNEINKWRNEGFEIDGIAGGGLTTGIVTTIVLTKKEE